MQHVLLVDDSADCYALVETLLAGVAIVTWARSITDATKAVNKSHFELILLDITLPDGSGFDFAFKLQEHPVLNNVPVVILTNRSDTESKIYAFQLGAIDYITKPFNTAEFKARIQAKLVQIAKVQRQMKVAAVADKTNFIKVGPLEIDKDRQRVTVNGIQINLTSLEFKTLLVLTKDLNAVVSRSEILQQVWNDLSINIRAVDTHVSKLRKKLGIGVIQSVHGEGYRVSA